MPGRKLDAIVDPMQRSEELPFLPCPINLDGTIIIFPLDSTPCIFHPWVFFRHRASFALPFPLLVSQRNDKDGCNSDVGAGYGMCARACIQGEIGNHPRGGIWEVDTWTGIEGM